MLPDLWTMPGTGWTLKSYGFMMMIGFLSAVYLAMRRAEKVKQDPDVVLNCSFIALLVGIIGSRIFYVVHYWHDSFAFRPNPLMATLNITQGGLEFLGGLVPAMIAVPLYLRLTGRSVRVYTDILAVSTMWALGISRIGCFLNGCCFGGLCIDAHQQPASVFAAEFPYGSPAMVRQWERRQITLPAELIADGYPSQYRQKFWPNMPIGRDLLYMSVDKRDKPQLKYVEAKKAYERAEKLDPNSEDTAQRKEKMELLKKLLNEHQGQIAYLLAAKSFPSRVDPTRTNTYTELRELAEKHGALWVHPTQLYSSVSALLLSIFLGRAFFRRKRHGVVFGLMMMGYPVARFALELIRSDNPHDTLGLTVSQFVSLSVFILGAVYLWVLFRFFPEKSPRAVPFVPELDPEPATA